MTIDRVNVLGVGISAATPEIAAQYIDVQVHSREKCYITVANVHSLVESISNEKLRQAHQSAGMTTPDGMPLVWMCHALGRKDVSRVYGPRLMTDTCQIMAAKNASHYFYGATDETLNSLVDKLENEIPSLKIAGCFSPPFRTLSSEENKLDINRINEAKPDILWIGLGAPNQEIWMLENRDKLDAPVIIGVGAAFDFISGGKPMAPKILQKMGLEWLFRLITEPKRLWRRYLKTNPVFVVLALAQLLGIKKF